MNNDNDNNNNNNNNNNNKSTNKQTSSWFVYPGDMLLIWILTQIAKIGGVPGQVQPKQGKIRHFQQGKKKCFEGNPNDLPYLI